MRFVDPREFEYPTLRVEIVHITCERNSMTLQIIIDTAEIYKTQHSTQMSDGGGGGGIEGRRYILETYTETRES